ncbi:MAG TPA: hypothetical protein VKH65_13225 [Myxococcales bacterium]|nr:MAG: hypothetical protein E6J64_17980 [Deltaproteobacteria bacterium]HMC35373.1 hypothetical protein [Myxococcales bacterium]
MSNRTLLLAIAASALASCAHEEVAPQLADRDWTQGLDGNLAPQIAPLGPLESDQGAYDLVRRRERERALGSKMTGVQLDEIIAASSQVLASALALPLFKAGVYLGQPRLLEKGCVAARRVTHSALRAASNVDAVLQACGALTGGRSSSDACGEAQQKLRDAYALLAAEKGNEAGHMAADAVRLLRDRCPKMTAPLRTPVDPSSRGFLIVWVLHANEAPPATFLAGETAPATAEAINEGFLRGVQALRTVAQNL